MGYRAKGYYFDWARIMDFYRRDRTHPGSSSSDENAEDSSDSELTEVRQTLNRTNVENEYVEGNCVPLMTSKIHCRRSGLRLSTREIRKRNRQHMLYKQWSGHYRELWDRSAPEGEKKRFQGDYETYVRHAAKNKAWYGIIEISAACRDFQLHITIHPVEMARQTPATWKGPTIAMGKCRRKETGHHAEYDGRHYELLEDVPVINLPAFKWEEIRAEEGDGGNDLAWMRGAQGRQ